MKRQKNIKTKFGYDACFIISDRTFKVTMINM